MPLEMEDSGRRRCSVAPRAGHVLALRHGRWWRPASTVGRVFLALGALMVLGGLGDFSLLPQTFISSATRASASPETSNIQATGLTEVSRAEMLPVFGEDIGRNIFFVPLGERRKQLEADSLDRAGHGDAPAAGPDSHVAWWSGSRWRLRATGSRSAWSTPTGFCSTMPAAMMAAASLLVPGGDRHRSPATRRPRARRAWRCTCA